MKVHKNSNHMMRSGSKTWPNQCNLLPRCTSYCLYIAPTCLDAVHSMLSVHVSSIVKGLRERSILLDYVNSLVLSIFLRLIYRQLNRSLKDQFFRFLKFSIIFDRPSDDRKIDFFCYWISYLETSHPMFY